MIYLYLPKSEPHNIRVVTSRYPIERASLLLPNHLRNYSYVRQSPSRLYFPDPPAYFIKISENVECCYNLGDF